MKELLERYHIYYEDQNGRPRVNASDIPSAEVSRYYIKESSYFDQRTSTFRTKVTALCPVLMREMILAERLPHILCSGSNMMISVRIWPVTR